MITKDNLIQATIKSYLKHFGLKIKNGFIYKNNIAIYTEPLEREQEVLRRIKEKEFYNYYSKSRNKINNPIFNKIEIKEVLE